MFDKTRSAYLINVGVGTAYTLVARQKKLRVEGITLTTAAHC